MSDRFVVNLSDLIIGDTKRKKLADLIKASFGGDRSAAGRYAANIRWQKQGKEYINQPQVAGATPPPTRGPIGDAMQKLADRGVTVTIRGQITEAEAKLLRQEVKERDLLLDKAAKRMLPHKALNVMPRFYEATRLARMAIDWTRKNSEGNPFMEKPQLVEMRDANGQLIGLAAVSFTKEASTLPDGKTGNAMFIDYLVSFGQVKKAGMALYGNLIKQAASRGARMAGLQATALSRGFWEKMGYVQSPLISGGSGFMYLPADLREVAKELP